MTRDEESAKLLSPGDEESAKLLGLEEGPTAIQPTPAPVVARELNLRMFPQIVERAMLLDIFILYIYTHIFR